MAASQILITVALPVGPGARSDWLREAIRCVAAQQQREFEAILALNGCSADAASAASRACSDDSRFRILSLPEPSLPAALNAIIQEARGAYIARMDADDLCPPDRLAKQIAALDEHPVLAGVGCAFDIIDAQGEFLRTIRLPTDPSRVRWRLLLGNVFAHGSMTLRAAALRAAGGYDESLARGQDYDLWLRMTANGMALGAVSETLYQRRIESAGRLEQADLLQARTASRLLLRAWGALLENGVGVAEEATGAELLARVIADGGAEETRRAIESELDEQGPGLASLVALLLAQSRADVRVPAQAWKSCWRARLREARRELRDAGAERVWLWGAGEHTRKILEHHGELGVAVAGLMDDALAGATRFGFTVASPDAIEPGEHVLMSSDAHEARMAASETALRLRARGVRIWRLYGGELVEP